MTPEKEARIVYFGDTFGSLPAGGPKEIVHVILGVCKWSVGRGIISGGEAFFLIKR
jgi:hypothetical protein